MTQHNTMTEHETPTNGADPEAGASPATAADDTKADDATELADVVEDTLRTEAPATEPEEQTFADFGVSEPIVRALAEAGITHPFPIQALTLPVALAKQDIIGQAKTGTGKTLGFGIPLLQAVTGPGEDGWDELPAAGKPQAVVVTPTRELAVQVAGDLKTASRHRSVRITEVYGGRAYEPQIEALQRGTEVIVGTPGRMIDLLKQGHLDLSKVRTLVLDEADEMLDLGFLPDVETLLSRTAASRHTMLFSATMPGPVVTMARRYMNRPTHIRAQDPEDDGVTLKAITQFIYRAHALDKIEVLARILQAKGRGLTLVFARTKRTAARVADDLAERGFASGAIHGDLGQGAREQALRAFRNGKIDVLVATDVAARGIDVDDITHVVNYQCPEDERIYLHRIGRTGRAGNTGIAVTFVDWDDVPRWMLIDKALGLNRGEPVETYSSSPHLYTDLDIPEGTRGRLPRSQRTRAGLDAEELEDIGETGTRTGGGRDRGEGGRRRSGGGRSGPGRSGQGGGGRGGQGNRGGQGRRRAGDTHRAGQDGQPRSQREGGSGEGQRRRRRRRRRNNSSGSGTGQASS